MKVQLREALCASAVQCSHCSAIGILTAHHTARTSTIFCKTSCQMTTLVEPKEDSTLIQRPSTFVLEDYCYGPEPFGTLCGTQIITRRLEDDTQCASTLGGLIPSRHPTHRTTTRNPSVSARAMPILRAPCLVQWPWQTTVTMSSPP